MIATIAIFLIIQGDSCFGQLGPRCVDSRGSLSSCLDFGDVGNLSH